ncbi:TetR family transcriptional regulator [Kiloniella sp. EL199]|uniref:TetR family transcriptional regulator n=1 Tax=Kiloniella sp. EL199 TaxID=2107581 RepID=UPI000EA0552F|nr:TetR family transcriptional regulator [Kiloniella sp. EL199]
MKISNKQKEANKARLIAVAVDLFSEHGFHNVSMKQISKAAEMGGSTIYKYFPNKDKFLLSYHETVLNNVLRLVEEAEDFADFTLEEKLQFFIYNYLDILIENREFVAESIEILRASPAFLMQREFPASKALKKKIIEILEQSVDSEEIPEVPFESAVAHLMVDALLGIILYWLQDDSEEFMHTTQFVEISTSFFVTLLKSDVLGKGVDLVGFMIKSQMMRFLENGQGFSTLMKGFSAMARNGGWKHGG